MQADMQAKQAQSNLRATSLELNLDQPQESQSRDQHSKQSNYPHVCDGDLREERNGSQVYGEMYQLGKDLISGKCVE